MLILPLHKPLTLENLPLATMLLVLVNVVVFFGFQSGDRDALAEAQRYYVESGLGRYEAPAYVRYLQNAGRGDEAAELAELPEKRRIVQVGQATLTDVRFIDALQGGTLFADPDAAQAWRPLRAGYDRLLGNVFRLRYVQRSSEWSPLRMLSSAFLHGDAMHLIGNMIFLLALGVLLEGAIGPFRFLGVYLLGAFGASAASLAWRWGDASSGLGASGAVAALMGAFCVVWGRQPVRFFYWFGVVFDYVKAPAIWLLPAWLGWEVYNLWTNGEAGIGFDAHAGGLVCGALTGALLVMTGQLRRDYIEDAGVIAEARDDRWERAQRHLGRMENRQAEALLDELAGERPHDFDIAMARYRAARNEGRAQMAAQRAMDVLRLQAGDPAQVRAQQVLVGELAGSGALAADVQEGLVARWIELGQLQSAEALLTQAGGELPRADQARQWFRLALGYGTQRDDEQRARVLRDVAARYPDLPQAEKARFLLDNA
ncbi:rhomboid family intramembrane serine protease [Pseudoxanthomonas wuyuanensis]|uniref:Membrane associated serine protease, rhomboid family n=1 Tax=Pseudoxanthomonas wuyuanensis TaxID=1073196 RepID=A0A286D982_9GAMM|nr:rhomboid family intramembrane serine protease [Pseudoxanthomonas wuyuanensis]KAF1722054.1 rhomboid family intramembrane serine protease [Pseudoxanthomonas wuyuanensis]SOD55204.1 Membrane associated serine protease, rhomboid family [Pseudoxanthomonas wuyuanensis]